MPLLIPPHITNCVPSGPIPFGNFLEEILVGTDLKRVLRPGSHYHRASICIALYTVHV